MLQKRIIVCLDVRNGRTTKGIRFQNNVDVGDPVKLARKYYREGADELVFYDITASHEGRGIFISVLEAVAKSIFIPFCVGGGIGSTEDMRRIIGAGAEKLSLNSQAVKNPAIIDEGARIFGSQCMVLGVDALRDASMPSGYRVVINGGRIQTDRDALAWALEAQDRGAGEVVLNSIDADGTGVGYELRLTGLFARELDIPVVASGGAGSPQHIKEVFEQAKADAALIAGMLHNGRHSLPQLKQRLRNWNIPVRL